MVNELLIDYNYNGHSLGYLSFPNDRPAFSMYDD